MNLNSSDKATLETIARKLGLSPKKLYLLINFESRFNPNAKNPHSSARGLIQFIDSTSQRLGYKNSLDLVQKNPTIKNQLEGPVYEYLKWYKPYLTDQSLFMAVFYPKARKWSKFRQFPDHVKKVNPGINTPADYIKKVYAASGLTYGVPAIILLSIGGILFFTFKRKGVFNASKKEGGQ